MSDFKAFFQKMKEYSSTKNQSSQLTFSSLFLLSNVYKWQEKKLLRKKSLVIKSLICDSGSSHLNLMPIKQSQQEVPYISVNTMMLKGTQQIPKVCEPQHAVRRPQWEELTDEVATLLLWQISLRKFRQSHAMHNCARKRFWAYSVHLCVVEGKCFPPSRPV